MGWDIGGIAKGILDLLKLFFARRKKPSDAFIDGINIRLISKDLVKGGHSIDCFFIILVHNHGGRLRPDNFMFWSIIDGWYNEDLMKKFELENYQLVNPDTEFLLLAKRICEKKGVGLVVDEMEESALNTSFQYERFKYIRFFYLKEDKRGVWFIMAATLAEKEYLDSIDAEGEIFIAINSVKNIIRGY